MSRCPNCSTEVSGEYCSACGQRRIRLEDLSARHFLREAADEVVQLRWRFKTLRSLGGLLSPGFLTWEHLAGRRQSYLGPIKLYLVCAAIFFLMTPLAGFDLASLSATDQTGALERRASARMAERALDRAVFSERFDRRLQTVYTLSAGIGVVVFALALQLLFRGDAQPFGAHLIFALHFVSFQYLLTSAAGASRRLGASTELASLIAVGVIVAYVLLALKRVYQASTASVLVKGAALVVVTLVANYVSSVVTILLTLRMV